MEQNVRIRTKCQWPPAPGDRWKHPAKVEGKTRHSGCAHTQGAATPELAPFGPKFGRRPPTDVAKAVSRVFQ